MERHAVIVAAIAALSLAFADQCLAQGQPQPQRGARPNGMRAFPGLRERWHQLSPEDRQRLRSNAERWLQLPPEERRELRLREGLRRERIRREAEAALQNSGLQLEADKRALYERRYLEERRRIDREMRREIQERRQRELAPVMEQLKKEFAQPNAAGSSSPATSPNK